MSKTIKRFEYRIHKMREPDLVPNSPIVEIILVRWTTYEDNTPIISPHLMTEGEIDEHIGALKAELDSVGRRAKAALQQAKQATMKMVFRKKRIGPIRNKSS